MNSNVPTFEVKFTTGQCYSNVIQIKVEKYKTGKIFKKDKINILITLLIDGDPFETVFSIEDIEYIRPN